MHFVKLPCGDFINLDLLETTEFSEDSIYLYFTSGNDTRLIEDDEEFIEEYLNSIAVAKASDKAKYRF
jgi:hypothetical protein